MTSDEIPAIREATGAFCRSLLDSFLPAVRLTARFHGYAIAVHGSLARDIDLISIPWTEQAVAPAELVASVRGAIAGVLGNCVLNGEPEQKPHGRIAYALVHPGFGGYIDLSVIVPHSGKSELPAA